MKKKFIILVGAVLFAAVSTVFLWEKGCIGMKIGLTDKEKESFLDIDTLNKLIAEHRFEFTNRKIQQMNLSGIEMIDTEVINVEINNSDMKNSKFYKVKFRNVDFVDVDFSDSSVKDTVFDHCTFSRTKNNKMTINNSQYVNCKFTKSEFCDDTIDNVIFKNNTMSGVEYFDTNISNCSFKGSNMNDVDFLGGEIDGIEIHRNTMDSCGFMKLRAKEIVISDSIIKGNSLDYLEVSNEIKLINCTGVGFSITVTKVPKISVIQLDNFEGFTLSSVDVNELLIDKVKIHDVGIYLSKIKTMTLTNSDISLFGFDDSKELGFERALFANTTFDGFGIQQSNVKNLSIENCLIGRILILQKANFENLNLKNVIILPSAKYVEEDVTYDNKVRFKY